MKRFIRFLAKISGVEKQIEDERNKIIGSQLVEYSYWLGATDVRTPAGNALDIMGRSVKGEAYVNASMLRDKIDERGTINIHKVHEPIQKTHQDNT